MIPETDRDTTIEEIHQTRERLAAKFGGNIRAILDDARSRQAASKHPTWQGKSSQPVQPDDESNANSN